MIKKIQQLFFITSAALICLICLTTGCEKIHWGSKASESPETSGAAEKPIPTVEYFTVTEEPVPLIQELPGRTSPFNVAEVRPQVTGIVLKRKFDEGSLVQEGQELYEIDSAVYQANYDKAVAHLNNWEKIMRRAQELQETRATSRQEFEDALYAWQKAKADVDLARINLVYCKVKAPLSGKIGFSNITVGALVTNGQECKMAVIQQLDPIYVDLNPSIPQILAENKANKKSKNSVTDKSKANNSDKDSAAGNIAGRAAVNNTGNKDGSDKDGSDKSNDPKINKESASSKKILTPSNQSVKQFSAPKGNDLKNNRETILPFWRGARITLVLEDGSKYEYPGTIKVSDNHVQQDTGTITLRAEFPNPEGKLIPGMFVRTFVEEGIRKNGLLIPQQALCRDMKGEPYVWIIRAKDNKTEMRMIRSTRTIGNAWLVDEGLEGGDRIVVEGLQYVSRDTLVNPVKSVKIQLKKSFN